MATRTAYANVFGSNTIVPNCPILENDVAFTAFPGGTPFGVWIVGSSGLSLDGRPGRQYTVESVGGGSGNDHYVMYYDTGAPGVGNRELEGHDQIWPGEHTFTMPPTGRVSIECGPGVTSFKATGAPEPPSVPPMADNRIGVAALGFFEGGFDWGIKAGDAASEGDFAGLGATYLVRAHFLYNGRSGGLDHWHGDLAVNGEEVVSADGDIPANPESDSISSVLLRPFNGLHGTELNFNFVRIGSEPGRGDILFENYSTGDQFPGFWTGYNLTSDAVMRVVGEVPPALPVPYPNSIGDEACDDFLPIREKYGDPQNTLCIYLHGLGYMLKQVDDIAKDGPNGEPGWSQIFDLERAKTEWLPWMGQLVGYKVPPKPDNQTVAEYHAKQKARIITRSAYRRGTTELLLEVIQEHLGGSRRVIIEERYGDDPYVIKVWVFEAEIVTSIEEIRAAALAQKMAGLLMEFSTLDSTGDYNLLRASSTHYTDVIVTHPDYESVLQDPGL